MTALVVDTSAATAVLLSEPGAAAVLDLLDAAELRLMSAASLVELALVVESRLGEPGRGLAERFAREGGVEVVALHPAHALRAIEGWRRFGKGRHPAGLNLGDCFTYGLAVEEGLPVLCVGDDFRRTDVAVVPLDV